MKRVSRSIFYTEKKHMHFFLGDGDTIEHEFNNKLLGRPFLGELKNNADNILRLFNNACYICTCAFYDDYPPNFLDEYVEMAIDSHDEPVWTNHMVPATMALIVNWLGSEECQKISVERGRRKEIEELCGRIRVSIEKRSEGKEDFQVLTTQEHQLPSGFINDKSFLCNTFSEAMNNPLVKPYDIFKDAGHLANLIKNNPDDFYSSTGPDSKFSMLIPNIDLKVEEKLRELYETLKIIFEDNCSQGTRSSVHKDNKSGVDNNIGDIEIGDSIIDVIKILHAMCKIGLFKMKDGTKIKEKTVMEYFGKMLNKDFSQYSKNLSVSKSSTKEESYLKVFDELRNEASKYYNKS